MKTKEILMYTAVILLLIIIAPLISKYYTYQTGKDGLYIGTSFLFIGVVSIIININKSKKL